MASLETVLNELGCLKSVHPRHYCQTPNVPATAIYLISIIDLPYNALLSSLLALSTPFSEFLAHVIVPKLKKTAVQLESQYAKLLFASKLQATCSSEGQGGGFLNSSNLAILLARLVLGHTCGFFIQSSVYLLAGDGVWGRGRRLSPLPRLAL